ncbi:ADP-ribosylglycohydrolase [Streptoalloteichus tenebrarius]|uniref:ADP-ribosylglycohydrolase n=1 Tax=Streptoalloteichus tenebrarius (strain ATCC 17920 / DSM 40477 / JCM 4838 / CBS 697.72 / NBRC 16177 / NCIMB 11028 / NRRL B-12390 / A12253. 1 / ISP 5477) TaxID=1933 RepID=A0ABT1HZ72_STRSD|nr:ADP-ribosylglycohydrolase family protein [Streptoalloteichus tenebrarius]MCP2260834.1 ADP-ribosylglycohydrolase [Streptoalloteichus tenebrarius]BFF00492.1 hypothetical protein GCM10020241_21670 [Streptoalloteichus tenebrarius]
MTTSWEDRVVGLLLGGALGDALGAPVEFAPLAEIRARFGPGGPDAPAEAFGRRGAITDDTQMTLFTVDGLVRANVARRLRGERDHLTPVQHAYQRWLHTQDVPWEHAAGPFHADCPEPDGWLVREAGLFRRREPGKTCLRALDAFARTGVPATFSRPANDSKGCGGVMRAAPAALWSTDLAEVFHVGAAVAALTHGHPSGFLPAGALAVVVRQLLWDQPLERALWAAMAELRRWPRHEETATALNRAFQLAQRGVPAPEEIEQHLGGGWVGEEALAIAVCAALAAGDDVELALRIAVNHSGDSDSTGAICGTIVGARVGARRLPERWLAELELREVIEELARDAAAEFGSTPPRDERWLRRYPAWYDGFSPAPAPVVPAAVATATPAPTAAQASTQDKPDRAERMLGCVLGGAVGDALGYAVEFDPLPRIREKYGERGLTDFVDAYRPAGSISDDTQMTLFTLEGLIRASLRRRLTGEDHTLREIQHAYQRWLHTQGQEWAEVAGEFLATHPEPDGWLIANAGLFQRRAPGHTCISALRHFAAGNPPGSVTNTINNSKGCGGVMRAAPAAFATGDRAEAFRLGVDLAAITHTHPSGYLSAGAMAVIVWELLRDVPLVDAVHSALSELEGWDGREETVRALRGALRVAEDGVPTPEEVEARLGLGWVGEETLAMAVCAALVAGDDVELALRIAVNHSGDSDSVGAVCGNILGAALGARRLPQRWLDRLELRPVIERLSLDAVAEFGPNPPEDEDHLRRYPVGVSQALTRAKEPQPAPVPEPPSTPETQDGHRAEHDDAPAPVELTPEEHRLLGLWREFRRDADGLPKTVALALHVLSDVITSGADGDDALGH